MKNIWRLFTGDLKRAVSNTVTIAILFGLVVIPSIFSWFNMMACWNVFENTGNLTVAVANADEGYQSDLVPLPLNIGDQVVSALRANDQLNWVFTDVEDAVDGARSGRYYAAVVIPQDFSRDMMTFYAPDAENATIIYYSNEKKSAIAPKVTDQGADRISNQVNSVFAETLSEIGLGLSSALLDYADGSGLGERLGKTATRLHGLAQQTGNAADVVGMYSATLASAQALADDAKGIFGTAASSAQDVSADVEHANQVARGIGDSLSESGGRLSTAIGDGVDAYDEVPAAIDHAFASSSALAQESASQLRARSSSVASLAEEHRDLAKKLDDVQSALPESFQADLEEVAARLRASASLQEDLAASLVRAAERIESDEDEVGDAEASVEAAAKEAADRLDAAKADYEENLQPSLATLAVTMDEAADALSSIAPAIDSATATATDSADSVIAQLDSTRHQLDGVASSLRESAGELDELAGAIETAAAAGDSRALRDIIGSDPTAFAAALTSPVALERTAVYPVENFGSAMSPLYTTLALWIGALLMMVTLKVIPSRRTVDELDDPTLAQLFCGRFGIVAVLSLLQSTVVALGNLLFLRVQAQEPLLYLLCFWISGLVFAFIIYTLVASFGNLGKGIGVLLLILQVTGGGGSFPLVLLPDFVQTISPYLPISHVVLAMRAAMFGVYQADFWIEMGTLLLFTIPCIVIGLVVRKPMVKVTARFVQKVEASKIM